MYLEVAVASPIANTLTYQSHPDFPDIVYKPGLRVLVPLGPRLVTAYILRTSKELKKDLVYKIRTINDILDPHPMFPESMIPFFEWLANYYQYPIGEVIKTALPGGLTPQSGRIIELTPQGQEYFKKEHDNEQPEQVVRFMSMTGG